MSNDITFLAFLKKVEDLWYQHGDLRYGQSVMNVLYEVWPEKYEEIKNTETDCFYDEKVVRFTIEQLEKEWPSDSRLQALQELSDLDQELGLG